MVCKAQQNNLITGLCSDIIPRGVAILQYADDTIVCMENDVNMARNIKLLLYVFEQMADLKINFEKSEMPAIGGDNRTCLPFVEVFNYQIQMFPLKYLGVHIPVADCM
jgi:hypothetical protein